MTYKLHHGCNKFVQDDRLQRCLAILSVEPMLLLPRDKSSTLVLEITVKTAAYYFKRIQSKTWMSMKYCLLRLTHDDT